MALGNHLSFEFQFPPLKNKCNKTQSVFMTVSCIIKQRYRHDIVNVICIDDYLPESAQTHVHWVDDAI